MYLSRSSFRRRMEMKSDYESISVSRFCCCCCCNRASLDGGQMRRKCNPALAAQAVCSIFISISFCLLLLPSSLSDHSHRQRPPFTECTASALLVLPSCPCLDACFSLLPGLGSAAAARRCLCASPLMMRSERSSRLISAAFSL